jgi:D-alanyl-D-alanine carboxypeptidase/D-alanyl-D-alanine-endopeptidase (penicillin-binding protein 4)
VVTVRGERVSFVMLVNHANARASEAAQRVLLEWVQAGLYVARGDGDGVR